MIEKNYLLCHINITITQKIWFSRNKSLVASLFLQHSVEFWIKQLQKLGEEITFVVCVDIYGNKNAQWLTDKQKYFFVAHIALPWNDNILSAGRVVVVPKKMQSVLFQNSIIFLNGTRRIRYLWELGDWDTDMYQYTNYYRNHFSITK